MYSNMLIKNIDRQMTDRENIFKISRTKEILLQNNNKKSANFVDKMAKNTNWLIDEETQNNKNMKLAN